MSLSVQLKPLSCLPCPTDKIKLRTRSEIVHHKRKNFGCFNLGERWKLDDYEGISWGMNDRGEMGKANELI